MANLETLELTINGNAESAKSGIDSLVTSLSSLSRAVGKSVGGLMRLNDQLKELKKYGSLKLPNLSAATGAMKAVKTVRKDLSQIIPEFRKEYAAGKTISSWRYGPTAPVNLKNNLGFQEGYQTDAERMAKNPQWYEDPEKQRENAMRNLKENGGVASWAKDTAKAVSDSNREMSLSYKEVANGAKESAESTNEYKEAVEGTEKTSEESVSVFQKLKDGFKNMTSGLSSMFSKIKRIATTMLIRSAIRNLIKDIKEGITNVREWAKVNNHEFYTSMDSLKSKTTEMKNALGASLTPTIQALIPVIRSLCNVVIEAANWINQLISLLTGKSYWIKATEGVDGYTDSVNSAGSAAKDWLATFDELNVMTSSSGGGGSSSNTDYSNMFEEITSFDDKIREVVSFIKDNMQSIYDMAIATGTAIGLWKLGTSFAEVLPTLSTIFGFVATGAVIAVTLQATWLLTNEYLNTKDAGWLFADMLTTAIGSTAAWSIAKNLIGGQAGVWSGAITLTLSALTGISAVLGNADVGAFSTESISTLFVNALKAGLATGIVLKSVYGVDTLVAAEGAGSIALAVFGVSIGLKAALDQNVQMFSVENVIATVGAAVAAGLGTYMWTSSLAPSGAVAVGVFSVLVGLKATLSEDIELFSAEHIATTVVAAVGVGLSAFLFGAGAIPAGIIAIATFGALIGIKAIISQDSTTIEWGNIHLTEEQVDTFVRSKMFTVDPVLFMEITSESISQMSIDEQGIKDKLKSLFGIANVIRLGLATKETYANLKTQVDDLLDQVNQWITDEQTMAQRTITLMPELFGKTEAEQNEWLASDSAGWEAVKEFANGLGKQLADELVEGENGEIVAKRPERVATLLDEITRISEIIAGQDIATEAEIDLDLKLKDLDESGFTQALAAYSDYKKQMMDAAEDFAKTMLANKTRLVNSLKLALEIDPENEELKKQLADAEEGLQQLKDNWQDIVDNKFASFYESGKSMLQEWVNKNFALGSITVPWNEEQFISYFQDGMNLEELIAEIFNWNNYDLEKYGININDLLEVGGWDLLSDDIKKNLISCFDVFKPEELANLVGVVPITDILKFSNWNNLDQNLQKQLLSSIISAYGASGIAEIKKSLPNIKAESIIQVTDWSSFTKEQKEAFVKAIGDSYGSAAAKKAAKAAGIKIAEEVENGGNSKKPTITISFKISNDEKKKLKTDVESTSSPRIYVTPVAKSTAKLDLKKDVEETVKPTVNPLLRLTQYNKQVFNKDTGETVVPTVNPKLVSTDPQRKAFKDETNKWVVPTVNPKLASTDPQKKSFKTDINKWVVPTTNPKLVSTEAQKTAFKNDVNKWVVPTVNPKLSSTDPQKKSFKDDVNKWVVPTVSPKLQSTGTQVNNYKTSVNKNVIPTISPFLQSTASQVTDYKGRVNKNVIPTINPALASTANQTTAYKTGITKNVVPSVNPSLASTQVQKNTFKTDVGKIVPDVYNDLHVTNAEKSDLKSDVEKVKPDIYNDLHVTNDEKKDVKKDVESIKPDIYNDLHVTSGEKADVKNDIESVEPDLFMDLHVTGTEKDDVEKDIESIDPDLYTDLHVTSDEKNSLKSDIEGIDPDITAGVTVKDDDVKELGKTIRNAIKGKITIKDGEAEIGSFTVVSTAASGGIFDVGQVFLAREAGPEMIGTIGSKSAVANNDQIVSGIASGVASANEEQNALLRQQNQILMGILQKSGNVQISASSALGRVVNQSLSMYGALVGG